MKIAFFPGCMVDMFYPEVGKSAVRVLEARMRNLSA